MRAKALAGKLGDVRDRLAGLQRDAENVRLVAFDALRHEADRRRDAFDAAGIEIGPDRAGADDRIAIGRQQRSSDLSVLLVSANTIQLGLVPGTDARTVMRPDTPSAPAAVSTCRLSPRPS